VRASSTIAVAAILLASPLATRARDPGDVRGTARPTYGFRLGAVTATSSVSTDNLTAIGGGGYALFDIPGLLADVSFDLYGGESRARMIAGGLGAYLPFGDGETVPYVGGGVKLGWTRFGGDGATGLLPYPALGLLLARSWSPQVRAELSWFFQTGTERRAAGGPAFHANGPVLSVGMSF
jgi:hypothetical protein